MARLYTKKDIDVALRKLRIDPKDNKVTGSEAAKILTWRALEEHAIEHVYTVNSIRLHIRQGHFPDGTVETINDRNNLYNVEAIFHLPIHPKRGPRKPISETA